LSLRHQPPDPAAASLHDRQRDRGRVLRILSEWSGEWLRDRLPVPRSNSSDNGFMEASSEIGGLTTRESPWSRWQTHAGASGETRLNRRCALVADDEPDSRDALALVLKWCGYEVLLAGDGNQALDVAAKYRPELIFLDIAMPCRDGYEVCRTLRQLPEFTDARIVAVSGFSGETHDTRCSEAGFTAQMSKPVDPGALETFSAG
jgi:CheY-like chemotaxis protein